ncbi:DNA polymerase III subunit gamma and tau [Micrococcaceae bacterium Sec5.7]
MTVTTALYRRYRPDSFADVIGQEHVTEPLMTALRKNRVNHAYLFSGPRGCGKTTSARILARCLNCADGPTDTPCGKCPSCIELARGGSGSLDVIEIDAASHGGVDDARDLRERATYAPVRDRYKIFIIDEAHMVTSAGFNALLKIVEEPPEHIKFIFATTEPDKVIGTIRSRTHHYPFRLVPPEPLMAYLELLCNQENVPVAPGVLSLVIRAGGGSVRDSLSVLDQLMAGAGADGLNYELAVALLGYTHASLLDDVIEAVAASDAVTVFRAVDRVIQTGHDPRRFVEDLLERFRDLIIVQAMPESAQTILRGVPADQIARLQNQAHNLGAAELSRAADVTNTALTEMTGATSPRLHLELLCARILLPSSEQTERGIAARIDRVERRLNYAGNDVGAPATAVAPVAAPVAAPDGERPAQTPAPMVEPVATRAPRQDRSPEAAARPTPAPAVEPVEPPAAETRQPLTAPRISTNDWPVDEAAGTKPAEPTGSRQARSPDVETRPAPAPVVEPAETPGSRQALSPAVTPAPASSSADVEVLRRAWPEVLQTLSKIKRSTWALVEPNAQVGQFDGQVLTLAFTTPGLAGAFGRADHSENLRQAIHKTIGIDCQITAVAGGAEGSASSEPNPKAPASRDVPVTSTDAGWGLTPEEQSPSAAAVPPVAPAPAPLPAAEPEATAYESRATPPASLPSASLSSAAPTSAAPPAEAAPESPSGAGEAARAEPTSVEPDQKSETAGSSSYSDGDWGPPRDEDAPPLDEEPPMDWDPSAPVQSMPATAPADTEKTSTAKPAARTRTTSRPKSATSVSPVAAEKPDTSQDQWARAVEQAPGVWLIGAGTNVGSYSRPPVQDSEQAATPEPAAPHYEPAAAQMPQAAPAPAEAPVYAMAAAPAPAAPLEAAPATSPSAAAARQSLYQRLSNSPEAEAGRAKAPARTAVAGTKYVQDIPSADDETIEESGVFGRAAVERILGGKLIEERSLDGSPLPARF